MEVLAWVVPVEFGNHQYCHFLAYTSIQKGTTCQIDLFYLFVTNLCVSTPHQTMVLASKVDVTNSFILTTFLLCACLDRTFSAIPLAYDMFITHKLLCALCFSGILLNMTRNRTIHGLWCCAAFYLLKIRGATMEW